MERLTIDEVIEHCKRHTERMEKHSGRQQLEETPIGNSDRMKQYWEHRQVAEWLEKLKAYEQAEEDGLLIRLPCKVGDVVYYISNVGNVKHVAEIKIYRLSSLTLIMEDEVFGKTVFLTKPEAEQALAKMKGEEA